MNSSVRLNEVERFIQINNEVSVSEISEKWGITEETVRRDLDKLAHKGIIERVHGGAIWVKDSDINKSEIDYYKRQVMNIKEKRKIALISKDLIKSKRTIFCDSSSTCIETLKLLKDETEIVVVTNSCEIFKEINVYKPNLISTGGIFNQNSLSYQGNVAKDTIKKYNAELAIIGSRGLDINAGATDSYDNEFEIKKEMIDRAKEVALLVDNSKFDRIAFIKLTDLEDIDYIITDKKPSSRWVDFCNKNHIKLLF